MAALLYFYRNSSLQTGEFERMFKTRLEAARWVNQFKGRSVMIRRF